MLVLICSQMKIFIGKREGGHFLKTCLYWCNYSGGLYSTRCSCRLYGGPACKQMGAFCQTHSHFWTVQFSKFCQGIYFCVKLFFVSNFFHSVLYWHCHFPSKKQKNDKESAATLIVTFFFFFDKTTNFS